MKKHIFTAICCLLAFAVSGRQVIVVSPGGKDTNAGSAARPLRTVEAAVEKARLSGDPEIEIVLREGVYYLSAPLRIDAGHFAGKKLLLTGYDGEVATLSGGRRLDTRWEKSDREGCWAASVDAGTIDQLFVNGQRRVLARYPDYTADVILNGTAADALSPKRVAGWKNPTGGFIHSLHGGRWGGMHYVITGKNKDELLYEGGFQNNRPSAVHPEYRFVENIFEELDAPGEWFFDKEKKRLYYYPLPDEDIEKAVFEAAGLPGLLELQGTPGLPLRDVTVRNLRFIQTARTFMQPYEPLMRSDWCIYRGAAVFFENTEDCLLSDCEFTNLGGNAVFVSRYNLNARVMHNHIHHIGASAVCLVGDTSAVRLAVTRYERSEPYDRIDRTPGPANRFYPRQCTVEDNLIHHIGEVEKQVAGVQIQIAAEIDVRHNTIYRVPRAAINVGDGAFGGHLIEYNDAFETVLETSDHGAFNSWGRDRYWNPDYTRMAGQTALEPELILLDAVYTNVLRNNRFRCDHGWDIDLDDGSSNYHIYGNVCLHGGIKLREGFFRTVENNIVVNNSLHPHVWFPNSGDVVRRNIFMTPYAPIALNGWGKNVDYNFFASAEGLEAARRNGTDGHSVSGNLVFADPSKGIYTLPDRNPASETGFENVPVDRFGVYTPRLKAMAGQPVFPELP